MENKYHILTSLRQCYLTYVALGARYSHTLYYVNKKIIEDTLY